MKHAGEPTLFRIIKNQQHRGEAVENDVLPTAMAWRYRPAAAVLDDDDDDDVLVVLRFGALLGPTWKWLHAAPSL